MVTGYDIIGDVHGCADELWQLMNELGYGYYDGDPGMVKCPTDGHGPSRKLVFVGDLNDRGPATDKVFKIAMHFKSLGLAEVVQGNHDNKLMRYLREELRGGQSKVRIGHGLAGTLEQLDRRGFEFKKQVFKFLEGCPTIFETDDLIVVHAAYNRNATGKEAQDLHLYGMVDRKAGYNKDGFPVRLLNWRDEYTGTKTIVVGHIVVPEVDHYVTASGAHIYDIDTGCCFGGKLTALRFPEMKIVQVPAREVHWKSK